LQYKQPYKKRERNKRYLPQNVPETLKTSEPRHFDLSFYDEVDYGRKYTTVKADGLLPNAP
jgi:hypothetical protein